MFLSAIAEFFDGMGGNKLNIVLGASLGWGSSRQGRVHHVGEGGSVLVLVMVWRRRRVQRHVGKTSVVEERRSHQQQCGRWWWQED